MSTPTQDLVPMFQREINLPAAGQITITGGQIVGYIEDGFWDARLSGVLENYTIADGADINDVGGGSPGQNYFTDISGLTEDLPKQFWMLITIFGGFRLLRLRIMELAVNFSAQAGPVSYEQEASATVLRALLDNLQGRIQELKGQYSDEFSSTFVLMDAVAQREYAMLAGLAENQILL